MAAKNSIQIDPAAANFGFAIYQNNNPTQKATRILGRQFTGIKAVASILFDARISRLQAVRRTFDENGPGTPPAGGGSEALRSKIATLGDGLYTVYPLEFEFTGSEDSLQTALGNLAASPYVLIPRFLVVTSKRTAPVRIDDLARSLQGGAEGQKKQTFLVAMGDEEIHVRIRIDLVEWTGETTAKAPKEKGQPPRSADHPQS